MYRIVFLTLKSSRKQGDTVALNRIQQHAFCVYPNHAGVTVFSLSVASIDSTLFAAFTMIHAQLVLLVSLYPDFQFVQHHKSYRCLSICFFFLQAYLFKSALESYQCNLNTSYFSLPLLKITFNFSR